LEEAGSAGRLLCWTIAMSSKRESFWSARIQILPQIATVVTSACPYLMVSRPRDGTHWLVCFIEWELHSLSQTPTEALRTPFTVMSSRSTVHALKGGIAPISAAHWAHSRRAMAVPALAVSQQGHQPRLQRRNESGMGLFSHLAG